MKNIAKRLEEMGCVHAPFETFEGSEANPLGILNEDRRHARRNRSHPGRCIILSRDPPGAYYILGTDVIGEEFRNKVQLMFLDVPDRGREIAKALDFWIEDDRPLPVTGHLSSHAPIPSYILAPRAET